MIVYVNTGKIHAKCKGTKLFEISQSSNITCRLCDYDRHDKGKLRELHINRAIENIPVPITELLLHNPKKIFIELLKE